MGTRFIVDRHADRTQVTVTLHSVRVAAPGAGASIAIVKEGQSVRYNRNGVGSVRTVEVSSSVPVGSRVIVEGNNLRMA